MDQSEKKIVIAVDGHSACGKSTLARDLADRLGYIYVDSGAMYRAVTLYLLRHDVPLEDPGKVESRLDKIRIDFRYEAGRNLVFLNGQMVEKEIRTMEVSNHVSIVAAIPAVRKAMVRQQQEIGRHKGIVMDGRDIGTVVFPDAELKIFLTADPETRVRRRHLEMTRKGMEMTIEEIRRNLEARDLIDSTREDSPLRKAEDAVVIDNTNLTREQQADLAVEMAMKTIRKTSSP